MYRECVKLLLDLLKFDTTNLDSRPSGYTIDILNFIKNRFSKKGIDCKLIPYCLSKQYQAEKIRLNKRANLLAFVDKRKPFLLLQGHVDTIPYDSNKWHYNPLGEVKGDKIYGRGAVDMKGPVTAIILAFEELTFENNLKYSPMLLLTSDEEANNFAGIKYFLRRNKKKISFAISAEPTNFKITTGLYGAIYATLKTFGKEQHSSQVSQNAIENMAIILCQLVRNKKFIENITDNRLGKSIFNFGLIRGGVKVNQIPGECELELAIRTVRESERYLRFLEKLLNKTNIKYKMKTNFKYDPIVFSKSHHLIKTLRYVLKNKKLPIKFAAEKGLTEATILNNNGIESMVFGPGDENLAHSENKEKISIEDILKAKQIYVDLFKY